MHTTLPQTDIVLLGIGHTNAHVLRMWKMQPIPDARLICVSNFPVATYSGMLPGVLAGQYPPARMEIDLVRLCSAANARLIVGRVDGLDVTGRRLLFQDRPPLPFDALSIGIGSVPDKVDVETDETLLAIKPMQTFLERLRERIRVAKGRAGDRPLDIVVVGAGVGGVEVSLCISPLVRRILDQPSAVQLTLISATDSVAVGSQVGTQSLVRRELERRKIRLITGRRVVQVCCNKVTMDGDQHIGADIVVWATGATAPPLLAQFDLPRDERGFLKTRDTLQTVAGGPIFAVGDSGTIEGMRLPKAGVYAVREGPILWRNLRHQLAGEPLESYRPQRNFLKLINLGDGRAIAEYHGFSMLGRWSWKLKDFIDSRFMDKYQDYQPMSMSSTAARSAPPLPMRCAGCGGKVSGDVLSRVLARLEVPASEHVLLGLDQPDDAAVIRPPGGRPLTVTVDFFTAPLDDPYLVGRIAALNAASDVFALGAQPLAALALITLPLGGDRQQEQLLYEVLSGGLHEFRRMGATLVGGHTIEGAALTVGYTLLADQSSPLRTKGQLQPGDALVLTKPLGTGVLLAGQMRALCQAPWMEALQRTMLISNQTAAAIADQFDLPARTDITGFGLAGHLLEMLRASGVACTLKLDAIPLLPGTGELLAAGVESTLAPANRAAEQQMSVATAMRSRYGYRALFDPQTCGGLLLGVPQHCVTELVTRLADSDHYGAAVIGEVVPAEQARSRIVVE